MIKKLTIQNFKSIKDLRLDCKRVNLFIGEPNVGKSNILEALAVQAIQQTFNIAGMIRVNDLSNLFFENDTSNKVVVTTDDLTTEIFYENGVVHLRFSGRKDNRELKRDLQGLFTGLSFGGGTPWDLGIHPYFFAELKSFPVLNYDFLSPPAGDNLFFLLQTNRTLRTLISDVIQERGFKLTLRPKQNEIEISKEEDSILTSYPYSVMSDTLQRIIFFIAAIETNREGSTLILEEPESNVFPYYAKYLAEKISADEKKQYFITTHNPYFLQSIIEKTPISDLAVNLVSMQKYQTINTTLSEKGKEEILNLSSDVFLNFDKLLEA